MFGLKFFILLLAQMTMISNRLFLSIQCHSIDFLLRIVLYLNLEGEDENDPQTLTSSRLPIDAEFNFIPRTLFRFARTGHTSNITVKYAFYLYFL